MPLIPPTVATRLVTRTQFSDLAEALAGQTLVRESDLALGRVVMVVEAMAHHDRPGWMADDCWKILTGACHADRIVVLWGLPQNGRPASSTFTVFKLKSLVEVAASSGPPPDPAWWPMTHLVRRVFSQLARPAIDILEQEEI